MSEPGGPELAAALTWSGSGADVSVFVVGPEGRAPAPDVCVDDARPSVRVFPLEQDAPRSLPGFDVVEVDAHFATLPGDLARYLTVVLHRALDLGAVVAWCAFEGSFHFDHLLTDDVAGQVYGVASAATGVRLALRDDARRGPDWAATVRAVRAVLTG